MNKRTVGSRFEEKAAAFLTGLGMTILEHNLRCRFGEIDLVAQDGEFLVFVEVKYRSSGLYGPGEAHVTRQKQQTIARVAEYYLALHGLSDPPCRFDVVAIDREEHITYLQSAFEKQ